MPTFGAFFIGREVANSDTFPDWAAKELMDTIQKKGKGQQDIIVGRCTEVHANILLSKLVEMKWHSSPWLKRSGNNVGEIHDFP